MDQEILKKALRDSGFKVTKKKIALLHEFKKAHIPLSVQQVSERLGAMMNTVTIYRSVELFVQAGLLARIDLQAPFAYYEFVDTTHHHHHLSCVRCHRIEDVSICLSDEIQNGVLRRSKNFTAITSHSLEFFGVCSKCG